jgi:hypothetical protein
MKKMDPVILALFACKNNITLDELAKFFDVTKEELNKSFFSSGKSADKEVLKKINKKLKSIKY